MQNLPETYKPFFDLFETLPKPQYRCDQVYYMAIDAEWYESRGRNVVLSYQLATVSRTTSANIIKYVPAAKRLTLPELVGLGIASVNGGSIPEDHQKSKILVVLVSHNVAAEWSVLADRDEPYLTKKLTLIRRSPVTGNDFIDITIAKKYPVWVKVFDTMLLAPASHQSLKKLSSLIGDEEEEKRPVSQFHIEHMNIFLRDQPEEFERYALKDTEVTIKLFFLLQRSLNELVYRDDKGIWNGVIVKLFRTLASAGVEGFLSKNPSFVVYREHLGLKKAPKKRQLPPELVGKFSEVYKLIKRAYHGGRNEGYFVGRTTHNPATKDRIWVDVDYSGCYPTAMARCPKIDVFGKFDYIPLTYKIDDKIAKILTDKHIPPEAIREAREALAYSPEAFNRVLREMINKSHAATIRYEATVIDNRLIRRWMTDWKKFKRNLENPEDPDPQKGTYQFLDQFAIPGFARVRFKFPGGTRFPCLPVKHYRYGLIYPLEGETVATAPEIMLAVEAGAEIKAVTSLSFPMVTDESGLPERFFLPHLREMTTERGKYKKDKGNPSSQILEKLLKEFVNSFYGKFAQGINPRSIYQPTTGEMRSLGPSAITEPYIAALTTGLARAALSATLMAVEDYNKERKDTPHSQIHVISATTDGLLIGLPNPKGYATASDYYVWKQADGKDDRLELIEGEEISLENVLDAFGCADLMKKIMAYLPNRQMCNARYELTEKQEFLEIKNMADEVISVKTRGQIGLLDTPEQHATILARFGHKPPLSEEIEDPEEYRRVMEAGGIVRNTEDSKWIIKQMERIAQGREDLDTYSFITLSTFRKMIDSNGQMDMVKQISKRKINTDFDWKRKLVEDESTGKISHFSLPYQTVSDMLLHRGQVETIRKNGQTAQPQMVLHRVQVKGNSLRFRGGQPLMVARLFLRGVVQKHIQVQLPDECFAEMADRMNKVWEAQELTEAYPKTWSKNDLQSASRGNWEPGCIMPNATLDTLVETLTAEFGAAHEQVRTLIFTGEVHEETNSALLEQVVRGIIHGPRLGIQPFRKLFDTRLLPDTRGLLLAFRPHLTERLMVLYRTGTFVPGLRPAKDRAKLERLFYKAGLPPKDAGKCALLIAPTPAEERKRLPRNPAQKRCLDHLVMALQQPDINAEGIKTAEILKKLKRYGLSRNQYYALKHNKFTPHCINDTPANRQLIEKMAKALYKDPVPLLEALIDG
ncbi:MAG: hypothetical protein CXR31_14725 [Geobacter sp.]|nr:MAG: hypothetical protein CXR31_14725 [Geobacter sp.]